MKNGKDSTARMENVAIDKLVPYARNARTHSDEQILQIRASLREFGFVNPVLIDQNHNIIAGHGRIMAAKAEGMTEIPCVFVEHLTDAQKKAYMLADNKLALNAGWDEEMLALAIEELQALDFDINLTGFDASEFEKLFAESDSKYGEMDDSGALFKKFIIPPYSILDSRQGYWRDRKAKWEAILGNIGGGRNENLIGAGMGSLAKDANGAESKIASGTSIFDPMLCEILVTWFTCKGDKIIDPFAGGEVRGLVSGYLGREYHGNDLRQEQIDHNLQALDKFLHDEDFIPPTWTVGDSTCVHDIIPGDDFDMLLTCPPYGDLEVYSDNPADISNMPYTDFIIIYGDILAKTIAKLKDNAYIAIVVAEIRDKKGHCRGFVRDTIDIVTATGAKLYNDMVLVNAVGTAALRAGRQFSAWRKVVKTHQNVLVFVKGDYKKIPLDHIEPLDIGGE